MLLQITTIGWSPFLHLRKANIFLFCQTKCENTSHTQGPIGCQGGWEGRRGTSQALFTRQPSIAPKQVGTKLSWLLPNAKQVDFGSMGKCNKMISNQLFVDFWWIKQFNACGESLILLKKSNFEVEMIFQLSHSLMEEHKATITVRNFQNIQSIGIQYLGV